MKRISVPAELTMQTCGRHLAFLDTELAAGSELGLDFSNLQNLDSAAVALLLEWQRRARLRGCRLEAEHIPASLAQLLAVYDVEKLVFSNQVGQ